MWVTPGFRVVVAPSSGACLQAGICLSKAATGVGRSRALHMRRDDALQRPGRRLIWRVLSVGCTFNQPQVVICLLLPVLAPILTVTAWIYSRSHPGIVLVVMEGCASFCQPWSLQL